MKQNPKYDEIGYWSEIKLDIIKEYASAYSRILSSQKNPKLTIYTLMLLPVRENTYRNPPVNLFQEVR
jgi:hypothetical protein